MDDAQPILEYLPASYKNRSEGDYIAFLWEAFESNYRNGKYQFALLAYHMLYMSYVYFSVWQIKHAHVEKYQQASIFLAGRKLSEDDLIGLTSPFSLSKIEERTIFRMLRLAGCEHDEIKPFMKLVDDRNEIAHPNGNIFFSDQKSADARIAEILGQIDAIQIHMRPVVHDCLRRFLLESWNPDEREYPDAGDQIREVLIHANYFSQKDIECALQYDIECLLGEEHRDAAAYLFEEFKSEYKQE